MKKLSFGQIRIILLIAKYYKLSFDDISFEECNSLTEFSRICKYELREISNMMVKSNNLDNEERLILEDYYYDNFLTIQASEANDFPYLLYMRDYNLVLHIPELYSHQKENELELDTQIMSCYYFSHIHKLNPHI